MKTVIVLGNSRSGTSLTAGILSRLGVEMHEHESWMGDSPRGPYEDPDFVRLTRKIRASILHGLTVEELRLEHEAEICETIAAKSNSPLWGWKSAITHYMLDLFLPHVQSPHLVYVFRNPYSCALSWQVHMRDWCHEPVTFGQAMQEIAKGIAALCECVERFSYLPSLFVTYEGLKLHALDEANALARFLGAEITEQAGESIAEFVLPDFTTIKEPG